MTANDYRMQFRILIENYHRNNKEENFQRVRLNFDVP